MNIMANQSKNQDRWTDTPRDKPITERTEHANLDRPGAQAHPKAARDWRRYSGPAAWRVR
jgi:hypothetical protein